MTLRDGLPSREWERATLHMPGILCLDVCVNLCIGKFSIRLSYCGVNVSNITWSPSNIG